jgi:hypothetical protein
MYCPLCTIKHVLFCVPNSCRRPRKSSNSALICVTFLPVSRIQRKILHHDMKIFNITVTPWQYNSQLEQLAGTDLFPSFPTISIPREANHRVLQSIQDDSSKSLIIPSKPVPPKRAPPFVHQLLLGVVVEMDDNGYLTRRPQVE